MATLRYLYFPGCKLMPFLQAYDRDTRAVLAALDVTLVDNELSCCGYPMRHNDFTAAMFCGVRVLAHAAAEGLPLLTPCKCCYGNLKQADYWMRRSSELRNRINDLLAKESLCWREDIGISHLLNVLDEDIGPERIAARVRRPLAGLRAAVHYGCHALRPGDVTRFDNPLAPTIFERVVAASGAQNVQWPLRLECCGRPLWEKNDQLSMALTRRKLADARESDAQVIVTACTYCQLQFDMACRPAEKNSEDLRAITVSRLLAAAFDISGCALDEEIVSF